MDKRKLILFSVAIILLVVIVVELGVFYSQMRKKKSALIINPLSQYSQARRSFYDWDITAKQAHFEVLEALPEDKSLKLRFIFPLKYENNVVKSKIRCLPEDSIINYSKGGRMNPVSAVDWLTPGATPPSSLAEINQVLEVDDKEASARQEVAAKPLYSLAQKGDIFRGVCSDETCTQINKECQLFVPYEQNN